VKKTNTHYTKSKNILSDAENTKSHLRTVAQILFIILMILLHNNNYYRLLRQKAAHKIQKTEYTDSMNIR